MTTDLNELTIAEIAAGMRSRAFSCVELVQAYLDRIAALDDRVHAFVTVAADDALGAARDVDLRIAAGADLPPLAGVPIAVKDHIPVKGIRSTGNSRVHEHWVPETDAAAMHRLRQAGAIFIGKTNLNEYGWALPAETDLTPPTRNPWNLELASIGSSSGSGAAVAAGFCAAAIGTDGGGSARLPAGQHGHFGIKPTHGLVSRLGMDSSSMSEISPMARTTADTALLLTHLAGYEIGDLASWPLPAPSYADALTADIDGLRLGVPRRYIDSTNPEPEVAAAFEAGLDVLRQLGAELVEVEIPGLPDARAANFVVLNSEGYAEHAKTLRTHGDRYGASAFRYRWMGAFLSAADYLNAKELGRRVRQIVQDQFNVVQAIVTPISPVVTAEAARNPATHRKGANAAFTAPFNLTGHPAISVPAGISASTGLPIGLQLVGGLHDEATLFRLAAAHENATEWSRQKPDLAVVAGSN